MKGATGYEPKVVLTTPERQNTVRSGSSAATIRKDTPNRSPFCYAQMLDALVPPTVTNSYRGSPVSKVVFVAMTVLTIGRSLAHILLKDGGSSTKATIPLDRYQAEASDTIISMFALWGLSQLLLGIVFLLVLWRYQSLIPLMWVFVLAEWSRMQANY